jgi:hypothetical protein
MKLTRADIARVMECLLADFDVRKATKFVSPTFIVRATRQRKPRANARSWTVMFTFGKPNFRERCFVKACQKSGEPFPIRKVQLKFYR